MHNIDIINKVKDTLISAASMYREDQKIVYEQAIKNEQNEHSKWVLENYLLNSLIAEMNKSPLCDDTGIPHIIIYIGKDSYLDFNTISSIKIGVAEGLKKLPGRPMAVKGNDKQRLEQSLGLYDDPSEIEIAPIQIRQMDDKGLKVYILMQGGGPEIRGKTYRVFHQHKLSVIIDEIVVWAKEGASQLGCTPCIPAIGIGRSHFEASALMLEAIIKGNCLIQSEIEKEITSRINEAEIGPLGLGGKHTALATFLKVGPQRASGVRIVSLRLCCGVEPRVAYCNL